MPDPLTEQIAQWQTTNKLSVAPKRSSSLDPTIGPSNRMIKKVAQANLNKEKKRIYDKERIKKPEYKEKKRENRLQRLSYDQNYPIDIVPRNYNNPVRRHKLMLSDQECITITAFKNLYIASNLICSLSGVKLISQPHSAYQWSPDRIDSSRGYEPGNVRIVAFELNVAPTYKFEILREYDRRSSHDVKRNENELNLLTSSLRFIRIINQLIAKAITRVDKWKTKITFSRRIPDNNGSLISLTTKDITTVGSMFLYQY